MSITQVVARSEVIPSNSPADEPIRDRGFWARALDWLIATQKRRAKSALQRYCR